MVSEGLVFDVKRYAIHDGPGIRVSVFLKGCNLRCAWCHNPEGISPHIEKMYTPSRCIGCGSCTPPCPPLEGEGWEGSCPARARELSGKRMTVAEIMDIFEKERVFMEQSGGGVTFSGGEPMLQPEFLEQLLLEAGRRGFHRAVDTAGNVGRSVLQRISGQTDLFLYDLKMIDDQRHRLFTGVSNALILQNLHELSKAGKEIIIRIPLIGGVNDSEEDARATADFLQSLPGSIREIHLLPYHAIAQSKFSKLGRADSFTPFNPPDPEKVNAFLHSLGEAGFNVRTGG